MNYDYAYWLTPAKKPEGFKAWERRHSACLQQRDGKPFYDWTAAKKVGKRNGEMPPGIPNGLIGWMHPDRRFQPKMMALYAEYRRDFFALGRGSSASGVWHPDQPRCYFDFIEGNLKRDKMEEWLDAHEAQLKSARWDLEHLPALPPDAERKYAAYCAFARKHGLTPKPFEQWMSKQNGHTQVPQGHAGACA